MNLFVGRLSLPFPSLLTPNIDWYQTSAVEIFELVRAILRWGVGRDLLTVDPTFGLAPPIRKEKPRERDLSLDEIHQLWTALDKAPVSRRPGGSDGNFPITRAMALTLKLALVTGQRIGEVARIEVSELSLNDTAPLWTIPGARVKNGHLNRVPLSPLALQLIAEARDLAADSRWLFPSPKGDGPIDAHAPTKALERAREAIGLRDFRIHDLRRTAATQMAEIGVSPIGPALDARWPVEDQDFTRKQDIMLPRDGRPMQSMPREHQRLDRKDQSLKAEDQRMHQRYGVDHVQKSP